MDIANSNASSKKSILKKKDGQFQRSNSVSLGPNTVPLHHMGDGTEIPKKRAVILDENGVWRPGEQDDEEKIDDKHIIQCSVADRTAGERVSYRLIQQRSLDFGLYNQLTKCHLDKSTDSEEYMESGEINPPNASASNVSPMHCPLVDNDVTGRFLVTHSPSEDAVLQLIQSKEANKQFSLKDVLAHRVPELNEDEEDVVEGLKSPEDSMQLNQSTDMKSTS